MWSKSAILFRRVGAELCPIVDSKSPIASSVVLYFLRLSPLLSNSTTAPNPVERTLPFWDPTKDFLINVLHERCGIA